MKEGRSDDRRKRNWKNERGKENDKGRRRWRGYNKIAKDRKMKEKQKMQR